MNSNVDHTNDAVFYKWALMSYSENKFDVWKYSNGL